MQMQRARATRTYCRSAACLPLNAALHSLLRCCEGWRCSSARFRTVCSLARAMHAVPATLRHPACSRGGAVPARAGLCAGLPRVLRTPTRAARGRRVCQSAVTPVSACAAGAAPALASASELAGSVDASCAQALYQLAVLDPAGAAAVGAALGPLFSLATLLFIVRCACGCVAELTAGCV